MHTLFKPRHCTTCMKKLVGRSDQIYCSIECKNELHRVSKEFTPHIQDHFNPNVIRNYLLCEGVFRHQSNKVVVHRDKLFKLGFDVSAFDYKVKTKKGYIYQILEYRFKVLANGRVEIWRTHRTKEYPPAFLRRYEREFPDFTDTLDECLIEDVQKDEVSDIPERGGKLKVFFNRIIDNSKCNLTVIPFIHERSGDLIYQSP